MKTPISDKFYNVGEEWRGVPSPRESLAFAQQMERDLMDFQERESRMCQRNQNQMNENETPETFAKTLFGIGCYDLVRPLRVPSEERGCKGKIQLGKKYRQQADRMSRKHKKSFGVYRCPHCEGAHLTTKLEKANEYEPLIYICRPNK